MRSVNAIAACLVVAAGCSDNAARVSAEARPAGATEVSFKTPGGINIVGDFVDAGGTKVVILLHQWQRDASTWRPYLKAFKAAGVSALAIDAQGNGRSERQGNQRIAPDWDLTMDIQGAVDYLQGKVIVRSGGQAVARNASRKAISIGICGASYGANNALIYAAAHPDINVIALLSPGEDYHGLMIADAASQYKGVAYMMTSEGDAGQKSGPKTVREALGDRVTVVEFKGDKHGTTILDAHPGEAQKLAAFFAKHLGK
jgi:pimeloyl-ACP methyl ester carboxylesterase